jgi:hypothetical protein
MSCAYLHETYDKEHEDQDASYNGQCNDPSGNYFLLDISNEDGRHQY